ncbi:MAG TPA: heparan-alpha-glucosaminide N-acetyltransferase domain-containing protein [Pyrinomonadaceae bacterium]|nr:heparan-alpha-glucosaminide N-acetyltransferase domain-containing protein [Pyrinomonadaceae bacterium]
MPDSAPIAPVLSAGVAAVEERAAVIDVRDEARVAVPPVVAARTRLDSVDLLRGLVMVIMALDHVRDFFHHDALLFDPTDLSRTNGALFLTRWVTHFCAPVFVFLAGTGAFLSTMRGKTKGELSRFLLTRGLWLVLLELTVVRLGWTFNLDYTFNVGQVIWAIGWSMVALSVLIYLPLWAITMFGVFMIAVHNAFDPFKAATAGAMSGVWAAFHTGELTETYGGIRFFPMYPLIPWIGVMATGYSFGQIFRLEAEKRRRVLLYLGLALTLLFVLIRATNLYGDPRPWSVQGNALWTFFSFINCQKYPPSLLFLLMTLGPAIASLAFFERVNLKPSALAAPFVVFGRVPLFYYVLHLFVIHGLAVGFAFIKYGSKLQDAFQTGRPPEDYGYSLPIVYLVWIGIILALYPICRWFAGVKRRRKEAWLSYI